MSFSLHLSRNIFVISRIVIFIKVLEVHLLWDQGVYRTNSVTLFVTDNVELLMSVVKGVLDSTRGVNFSSKKNLVVLPRVESSLKPGDLCPLFAGGGGLQHHGG